MRIFCTSVEESIHKDEIYNKAKKVFKKYVMFDSYSWGSH